jgi:hypothetical protein
MILCEWGVEMRNPLGHIMFNGVKQGAVITTLVSPNMIEAATKPHSTEMLTNDRK